MPTMFAPLYKLLELHREWKWSTEEQEAFNKAKMVLRKSSLLVHYDSKKELVLACDASPYGLGAVLSHPSAEGPDRPIAFASRTLTKAEKNYAHIEKEALAIVFGVTKFRDYLLGRTFTLFTDHQPLVSLFSEHKAIPVMAASRIQRWALSLSAFSYKIKYRSGSRNQNADTMSRFPLKGGESDPPEPAEVVLLVDHLNNSPVTAHQVESTTRSDKLLSEVANFVKNGWPESARPELKPFWIRRDELSYHHGMILWGSRVIIPNVLQQQVLHELHAGHQGMTKLKGLARSYVWWPNLDQAIEDLVRRCPVCQQSALMPPTQTGVWHKEMEPYVY